MDAKTIDGEMDEVTGTFAAVYMVLAVCGVLLNMLVLVRLLALWMRRSEQFFDGCAMPLSLMALADLFSLIAIIVLVQFSYGSSGETQSAGVATIMCKVRGIVSADFKQSPVFSLLGIHAQVLV